MSETASEYWKTKLANPAVRLPIFEDDPQPGRYRAKSAGRYVAIAIWKDDDGATQMIRDGEHVPAEDQPRVWTWCAQSPISSDAYDRMASGEQDADPIYSQLPDAAPKILARVRAIGAMPTAPTTPDEAERLADAAHLLKTIEKKATDTAKELIAPLKARIDELSGPWNEVSANAKAARDPIMTGLANFLSKKNEPGGVKGQLGKAISLRTDKVMMIHDLEAALAYFTKKDPAAFEPMVEKLARAAIKNGEDVPGVEIQESRRAQ